MQGACVRAWLLACVHACSSCAAAYSTCRPHAVACMLQFSWKPCMLHGQSFAPMHKHFPVSSTMQNTGVALVVLSAKHIHNEELSNAKAKQQSREFSMACRLRGGAASWKKKCMHCNGSCRLRMLTWLSCTSSANQPSAELLRAHLPPLLPKERPLSQQQAKPCRAALATCCWPRCLLFLLKSDK